MTQRIRLVGALVVALVAAGSVSAQLPYRGRVVTFSQPGVPVLDPGRAFPFLPNRTTADPGRPIPTSQLRSPFVPYTSFGVNGFMNNAVTPPATATTTPTTPTTPSTGNNNFYPIYGFGFNYNYWNSMPYNFTGSYPGYLTNFGLTNGIPTGTFNAFAPMVPPTINPLQ